MIDELNNTKAAVDILQITVNNNIQLSIITIYYHSLPTILNHSH